MRVKMLIGGAIGDEPHEPGDVLDVSDAQGKRWISAGIAEDAGGGSARKKAKSTTEEEG